MKNAAVLLLAALLAAPAARAVTLDEAVQAALENSPTLQAAENRIDSAQAMLRQAKSYYYPSIGLSATYAVSDNPPQAFMMSLNQRNLNMQDPAFDPNNPDDTENLRGSVTAQWRLFDLQRAAGKNMARSGARAGAEAFAADLLPPINHSEKKGRRGKGSPPVQPILSYGPFP